MMSVKKINMIFKLVIHITNIFKIYVDTVRIIYSELFFPDSSCWSNTLIYIIISKIQCVNTCIHILRTSNHRNQAHIIFSSNWLTHINYQVLHSSVKILSSLSDSLPIETSPNPHKQFMGMFCYQQRTSTPYGISLSITYLSPHYIFICTINTV